MNELRGVIHGRTIELEQEPGLPDGAQVVVTVERAAETVERAAEIERRREALRRAAGGWAEDAEELDAFLEWNRQSRRLDRPEIDD